MSFERAYLDLMPDTVVITRRVASGTPTFDGVPTWDSVGSTYAARVTPRRRSQVDFVDGTVIQLTHVCWVASTGTISPQDRITLPDGSTPRIVGVTAPADQDGTHHHKLELG